MSGQARHAMAAVIRRNLALQWRAGQLSGQAPKQPWTPAMAARTSMEGRTIVRPGRRQDHGRAQPAAYFNGGPDNCPARPAAGSWSRPTRSVLQWRAGQLSGQAGRSRDARPRLRATSMEGRTIVRPGGSCRCRTRRRARHFNGGPDNCPARPSRPPRPWEWSQILQWRAGQLSGQAPTQTPAQTPCHPTSMEGRTIVRPGDLARPHPAHGCDVLQWRAGQLSGQAVMTRLFRSRSCLLQWRAGQLSGQAQRRGFEPVVVWALQWRAGQLSGQAGFCG